MERQTSEARNPAKRTKTSKSSENAPNKSNAEGTNGQGVGTMGSAMVASSSTSAPLLSNTGTIQTLDIPLVPVSLASGSSGIQTSASVGFAGLGGFKKIPRITAPLDVPLAATPTPENDYGPEGTSLKAPERFVIPLPIPVPGPPKQKQQSRRNKQTTTSSTPANPNPNEEDDSNPAQPKYKNPNAFRKPVSPRKRKFMGRIQQASIMRADDIRLQQQSVATPSTLPTGQPATHVMDTTPDVATEPSVADVDRVLQERSAPNTRALNHDIPNPTWSGQDENQIIQVTQEQSLMDITDYFNTVMLTEPFNANHGKVLEHVQKARSDLDITQLRIEKGSFDFNGNGADATEDDDDIVPLDIPVHVFGEEARMEETFIPDNLVDDLFDDAEQVAEKDKDWEDLVAETEDADDVTPDHKFHIALSTFWMAFNLSVQAYGAFIEVMNLLPEIPGVPRLPKSLQRLHKWADKHLPPTISREGTVQLVTRGLPAGLPKALNPKDKLMYCDPVEMTRVIVQNNRIRKRLYSGMQILVEQPYELWHSRAWGSSNRVSSGMYAFYGNTETTPYIRNPILVGDIVAYKVNPSNRSTSTSMQDSGALSHPFSEPIVRYGRIRQTCLDMKFRKTGECCAFIDPIIHLDDIQNWFPSAMVTLILNIIKNANDRHQDSCPAFAGAADVILLEEMADLVYTTNITEFIEQSTFLDSRNMPNTPQNIAVKFVARYDPAVPSASDSTSKIQKEQISVREAMFRHFLRGELEVKAYGRQQIIDDFVNQAKGPIISIPTLSFWDAYGTFGKGTCMYMSFLGGYSCLAGLPYSDRMSMKNYLPHAMGPMGCDMWTVMGVMGKKYRRLESNGIKSHKANNSCRMCSVDIHNRHSLTFNIHHNERFYHREEEKRAVCLKLPSAEKRKQALRTEGFKPESSPFLQARMTLDPFLHFPPESCHVLLSEILERIYAEAMREFPYTPDWFRIQDPIAHYASFSYSQKGQAAQANPFILRHVLRDSMIPAYAYEHLTKEFAKELFHLNFTVSDLVRLLDVSKFEWYLANIFSAPHAQFAETTALVFKQGYTDSDLKTLRIRLIQMVDLMTRFAIVSKDVDKIEKRSNIHALMHLHDFALEYGTLINIDCSPGEARHKPFKDHARQSNKKEVPRQLLSCVSRTFRISCVVDGSYEEQWPDITAKLREIQLTCPRTFNRIVTNKTKLEERGVDSDTIKSRQEEAEDTTTGGLINFGILRGPLVLKKRNTRLFPAIVRQGDWLRTELSKQLQDMHEHAIPLNYKPFRVGYYKRLSFISQRRGRFEQDMVLKAGRFYAYVDDNDNDHDNTPSREPPNIGILEAFLEYKEALDPLHFAVFRRLSKLTTDRVLHQCTLYTSISDSTATDPNFTTFSKGFELVPVDNIIHANEHVIEFKGLDPTTITNLRQKDTAGKRIWWRSPWYTKSY
ncbi:hypothetical protein BJ508DRAFT_304432 [Ascobolus immersus RN42]|uniref:Uncharacterized protein n=1 Tax=Ascobolus immersus RN42 TaxID=1160509 RepID=A0A3N4IIC9_ASCIM|nr:hypothetical protein BJ508DRAFT_304432 [Ascobolus immersus RN42]